ncbi:HAMP domain-containing protein [Candidatus Woesearchaeota archaeon]|nr:MAG: HAMP domain-containing protein [Candidatus Woesearchaeota archaeon]
MFAPNWYMILAFHIVLFDFYFIYLLMRSDVKKREKSFLLAATVMIILWQSAKAASLSFSDAAGALALAKLSKIPPLFMVAFVLLFVREHIGKKNSSLHESIFYSLAGIMSLVAAFTDGVVSPPVQFMAWGSYPSSGALSPAYALLLIFFFGASLLELLRAYLRSSGAEKKRLKRLFLFLLTSSSLGLITDTLLPLAGYPVPPLGGLMSSLFLGGVVLLISNTGLSEHSKPAHLSDAFIASSLIAFFVLSLTTLSATAHYQGKTARQMLSSVHNFEFSLVENNLRWHTQEFSEYLEQVRLNKNIEELQVPSSRGHLLLRITHSEEDFLSATDCYFEQPPSDSEKRAEYFFSWAHCSGSNEFVLASLVGKNGGGEIYAFFPFDATGLINRELQNTTFRNWVSLSLFLPKAEISVRRNGTFAPVPFAGHDVPCRQEFLERASDHGLGIIISRKFIPEFSACVEVATPLDVYYSFSSEWYRTYAFVSSAVLVILAALSVFVARRISRPLPGILDTLASFASGNFGVRMPVKGVYEFRMFASSFNKMARDVEDIYRELESYRGTLEKKVEQKTRQLKKKVLEAQQSSQAVLHVLKDVLKAREELKKSQKKLLIANRQLKALDKKKGEFMNIAAHELKTPLIPIVAYTEIILKSSKLTPEDRHRLEIVLSSAKRLQRLVQDVLDINKLESGIMKFKMEPFDIASEIRKIAEGYEPDITAKGVKLIKHIPSKPIMVMGDYQRLNQVFANLLDNAYKFTEKGSITVRVTREKKKVWVYVKDTGMGISKEDQSKVFTKFFQADTSLRRKQGGTGLGLSICRNIVRHHGGDIYFSSTLGKGTTFYYFVPVLRRDSNAEKEGNTGS